MVNPIREFRTHYNLSLSQLADLAGVTPLAITRCEQAVFTDIPPSIASAVLDKEPIVTSQGFVLSDPQSLHEAYVNYQRNQRKSSFGLLTSTLPESQTNYSPLLHWRLHSGLSSQMGFCKAFCVHPGPVAQIEKGRQRALPKQLLDALMQSGYPRTTLDELHERQWIFTETKQKAL